MLKYWRMLPLAARRYIFYHCLVTPLLFVWYIVPYLMLETGLSVAEAGAIFTASSAVTACLNFAIGRWLDRGSPNAIMAAISVVEGTAYLLYFSAFTGKSLALLLVAAVIERLSFGLYPVYAVYEYEAYPSEVREKAYVYHNVLPLTSQALTYPLIGYALGVVWPKWEARVLSLLAAAAASYAYTLLPLLWLPKLDSRTSRGNRVEKRGGRVPRGFYLVALALILLGLANSLAPPLVLVNLFMEVMGGGLFEISLYEAVAAVTVVAVSLPLLKVGKKRGGLMVALGLGLACASNMVMTYAEKLWHALAAAFLASAGFAIMDPFFMDILFSKIPEDKRGTLLGGIAGVRRVVNIASPLVAGVLAEYLFPTAPYLVSAVLFVAVAALTVYAAGI